MQKKSSSSDSGSTDSTGEAALTYYERENMKGGTRDGIEFSSTGNFIATTTYDKDQIVLFPLDSNGNPGAAVVSTIAKAAFMAVHPNGGFLFVGYSNHGSDLGGLQSYKVNSDLTLSLVDDETNISYIECMKMSPDGKLLIICHPENQEYRYETYSINATTGALTLAVQAVPFNDSNIGYFDRPRLAAFTPDGQWFITATSELEEGLRQLKFYSYAVNTATGAMTFANKHATNWAEDIFSMVISPDSKRIYYNIRNSMAVLGEDIGTLGELTENTNINFNIHPPNTLAFPCKTYAADLQISPDGLTIWGTQTIYGYVFGASLNVSTGAIGNYNYYKIEPEPKKSPRFLRFNSSKNKMYAISGLLRTSDKNGEITAEHNTYFLMSANSTTGELILEDSNDE